MVLVQLNRDGRRLVGVQVQRCRAGQAADGQFVEQVVQLLDQAGPLLEQMMATLGLRRMDGARHGEDLPTRLRRLAGGDQRSGFHGRLDHQATLRQSRDDAVALREIGRHRGRADKVLADQQSAARDMAGQVRMFQRVHLVRPGAEDCDRAARRVQRGLVRGAVDALRQPRDHAEPCFSQAGGEVPRVLIALRTRTSTADDRHAALAEQLAPALQVEHQRRIRRVQQRQRIVGSAEEEDRAAFTASQPVFGAADQPVELVRALGQQGGFFGRHGGAPSSAARPEGGAGSAVPSEQPPRRAA